MVDELKEVVTYSLETEHLGLENLSVILDESNRFSQVSNMLGEDEVLGWKIHFKEGIANLSIFTNSKEISDEDIHWIIEGFAKVLSKETHTKEIINSISYEVIPRLKAHDDSGSLKPSFELFKIFNEIEATVYIVAGMCKSIKHKNAFIISLEDDMSLRVKMFLSERLAQAQVIKVSGLDDLQGLNVKQLEFMTSKTLIGFMEVKKDSDTPSSHRKENIPDENSLENLKLRITAKNCLYRAGINTIDELAQMSVEELSSIRNMGRVLLREILEKRDLYCKLNNIEVNRETSKETKESNKYEKFQESIDQLVALEEVKKHIKKIIALAKMQESRISKGEEKVPISLNMSFIGNAGTAKSTVARLLSGLFKEIGILKSSEMVEVGRADLVGEYVGQTAPKVREVFKRAEGKLLFIDEAYSLIDGKGESYGDEAINTIVQEMENRRDSVIVIFAGYPGKMEAFFSRNPGLKSRIPFVLNFRDYSQEKLIEIVNLEVKKRGFSIDEKAVKKLNTICQEAPGNNEMGNGRFCRNLAEGAILNYALRKFSKDTNVEVEDDRVLVEEDFCLLEESGVLSTMKKKTRLGFITN